MRYLLLTLTRRKSVRIGRWEIFAYADRTLGARQDGTGLHAGEAQKPNLAGLTRILRLIDDTEAAQAIVQSFMPEDTARDYEDASKQYSP